MSDESSRKRQYERPCVGTQWTGVESMVRLSWATLWIRMMRVVASALQSGIGSPWLFMA